MQMPIVMPSQVISIIESLFPTVADQHFQQDPLSGVDFKQTNVLKGIVNLIHQIPGELMTISGNQYAQLLISNTIIEEALINMRIGKFNGFSRLNDVNPVAVIYNILKMCPDEFPASGNSDLSFVSDIRESRADQNDNGRCCTSLQRFPKSHSSRSRPPS
jgi:hypothetical protein